MRRLLPLLALTLLCGCAPKAPDAPSLPADVEGNAGAACTSHADCVTPGRYLMRSNCPFASRCLEDRCAVVCPLPQINPKNPGEVIRCTRDADCDCKLYAATDKTACRCVDGGCFAVME